MLYRSINFWLLDFDCKSTGLHKCMVRQNDTGKNATKRGTGDSLLREQSKAATKRWSHDLEPRNYVVAIVFVHWLFRDDGLVCCPFQSHPYFMIFVQHMTMIFSPVVPHRF